MFFMFTNKCYIPTIKGRVFILLLLELAVAAIFILFSLQV